MKTAADVPAFVDALMVESPDVTAIGDVGYWIIAVDDPVANRRIEAIVAEFGPRDHLFADIIACLKAKGRELCLDRIEEPNQCQG
jgi:hypothetical protein